jgi:prepilin-type N-terminal cleavage/methylation domain-containing protein
LKSEFLGRRLGSEGFSRRRRPAFTLIEVLVVVSILSLIILSLMSVFSSTQRAFRASVTQSDVLQGGHAAMELITADLRGAVPCDGLANVASPLLTGTFTGESTNGINFFVTNSGQYYLPLVQSLPGGTSTLQRTNLLQWFFVLGRQNTQWTGVGYFVDTASTTSLYPLYRYYSTTNITINPAVLFNNFIGAVNNGYANEALLNTSNNMSHLIDGVVHLVVRAYDSNGTLMTNGYPLGVQPTLNNTWFTPPYPSPGGEVGFVMASNALPASVEVQMGVLEDHTLKRAASLNPGQSVFSQASAWNSPAQQNYLQLQSGTVQVFRERLTIQNVDPSAYQ